MTLQRKKIVAQIEVRVVGYIVMVSIAIYEPHNIANYWRHVEFIHKDFQRWAKRITEVLEVLKQLDKFQTATWGKPKPSDALIQRQTTFHQGYDWQTLLIIRGHYI